MRVKYSPYMIGTIVASLSGFDATPQKYYHRIKYFVSDYPMDATFFFNKPSDNAETAVPATIAPR